MRQALLPSLAFMFAVASISIAADTVESGLKVGASAGAFNVKDCTGPAKGKSLCYR